VAESNAWSKEYKQRRKAYKGVRTKEWEEVWKEDKENLMFIK
jgi:hypothetical protein